MNLSNRVAKYEQAAGCEAGECGCARPFEVRRYESEDSQEAAARDETPPEICAGCGRPKLLLKVVYEKKWGEAAAV